MAKRKRGRKQKSSTQGCLVLLMFVLLGFAYLFPRAQQALIDRPQPAAVVTERPSVTITDTPETEFTPPPSPLPASGEGEQGDEDVVRAASGIYYTTNDMNVRVCPGTDCEVAGQVQQGTRFTITGEVDGEAVNSGNAVWYRVQYGGDDAFVYSGLMTQNQPQAQQNPPQQQQAGPAATQAPAAQQVSRPGNCSTAVAMGLSDVQAAQWSHLDRDNDGVACYGD